ncbi:MAG: hypothetical protein ACFBSC_06485 [Microcoleaceae cyanobacterium]
MIAGSSTATPSGLEIEFYLAPRYRFTLQPTYSIRLNEKTDGCLPCLLKSVVTLMGGSAIICPGVTAGDGSTIGAGSIVTRDVPSKVFAAGTHVELFAI